MTKLRPAAVPLITVDPFFSIWSGYDQLSCGATQHWSGNIKPIIAGVRVDGKFYSMCCVTENYVFSHIRLPQTDLKITPLSSIYTFENEDVKVTLTFTTPALLDRPDILSRPVSYVEYDIIPKKEGIKTEFVFGMSATLSVDKYNQNVEFHKTPFSVCCGNTVQNPLGRSGDGIGIDWGYLHLCDKNAYVAMAPWHAGGPKNKIDATVEMNAYGQQPYIAVAKKEQHGVITVAYDEISPIEYFGDALDECYTEYFGSFGEMVEAAKAQYPEIKVLCEEFDKKLISEAEKLGENYKNIVSLAYRQAIGSHKLVKDLDGNYLFLSKECDSNGCIGTLDVTYPSIPLFLKYNPELVKGMLRPIIKFAKSDDWEFDFTPHDVGQYPLANGQVYGPGDINMQMPVEEAGNMLLCLAAVEKYSGGDKELFENDRELMKKWADYLVEFGYDPGNQLCTDDFAGHLGHNCNLSLKAILGIAAYASLSGDDSYMKIAKEYAQKWEKDALAAHGGTRLTFDNPDGWSLKYNMVWDNLLGYKLFSDDVKKKEIALYTEKMNRYGVPLDSRADYTKIDWLMWSTRIYDDKEYFESVCQSIVNMINETPDRVPMTDWYFTSNAMMRAFRCRTVVGGLFINLI